MTLTNKSSGYHSPRLSYRQDDSTTVNSCRESLLELNFYIFLSYLVVQITFKRHLVQ